MVGRLLFIVLAIASGVYLYLHPQIVTQVWERRGDLVPETLLQERVSAPGPLRGVIGGPAGVLLRSEIVRITNDQRMEADFPPLREDTVLNRAAEAKLDDMFKRQYFEHVAPDGRGPADVVEATGYRYLRVGENLALGTFANETALVQAWMDSPGHRENILSRQFTEIGVAARQGTFEGKTVWLAVQTFATPLSACPTPPPALEAALATQQQQLEALTGSFSTRQTTLDTQKQQLESLNQEITALGSEAVQKINEGNAEIEEGNRIYAETNSEEQARPHWTRGQQLHDEGQVLRQQMTERQGDHQALADLYEATRTTYNDDLEVAQQLEARLRDTQADLNQYIRAFNECLNASP